MKLLQVDTPDQHTLRHIAKVVTYDNSVSGLNAINVQSAIDEINAKIAIDWQESVLDKDLNTPPPLPNIGDRYIIAAGGTGAWTNKSTQIAEWMGAVLGWEFTVPNEGTACWVEDENTIYLFNGTIWVKMSSVYDHNTLSGLQGGTTSEYYHLTNTQHGQLHVPITITDTTSVNLTLIGQDIQAAVLPAGVDHNSLFNTHNLTTDINHQSITGAGTNTHANIDSHISSTSNPHSTTFLQLTDTPDAYTSQAGKYLRVNSTPNAVEFAWDSLSTITTDITFSAEATKDTIINIGRPIREVIRGRIWITSDPNAFNQWATITLYNKAAKKGNDAFWRMYADLVYTELEVATTGSDANITPDDHTQFNPNDLIVIRDVADEYCRLLTVGDTMVAEDNVLAHVIDTGVSRVIEFSGFNLFNNESGTDVYLRIKFGSVQTVTLRCELIVRT